MTKLQKVLVVDASRVVRASLFRGFKEHFEICEEADGESAWQTLVLDSTIVAVVSGGKLAMLDGLGLVERMRASPLCRLNRLPFFLLVSDSFTPEDRSSASLSGVSGFIQKGAVGLETVALLKRFIETLPLISPREVIAPPVAAELPDVGERSIVGVTDVTEQVVCLDNSPDSSPQNEQPTASKEHTFLDGAGIEQGLQELMPQSGQSAQVGLLVFALDDYADLVARCGGGLAWRVVQKISVFLADKIRSEDRIGHLPSGRIAIIAPHVDIDLCTRFSLRICKTLSDAHISLRGQQVGVSVSVGIAVWPVGGGGLDAQDLLRLANDRVNVAMRLGGGRVVSGDDGVAQTLISRKEFVVRLRELLAVTEPEDMVTCLADVGLQILPILNQIEQTFHFGLPVEEMKRRLSDFVEGEK